MEDYKINSLNNIDFKNLPNFAIWLISNNGELKPISEEEKEWTNKLAKNRSLEYQYSRGYV